MATTEIPTFSPESHEPARRFGTPEDDYQAYSDLAELMRGGKHGNRWQVRDFEDDPHGLLSIDKAYVGVLKNGSDRAKPLETFGPLLISDKSRGELGLAFHSILSLPEINEHRERGGMIIFVPVPHTTNADLPVSAVLAGQDLDIALNQTVLMHRQVPLSELRYYNGDGELEKTKIVDDGILLYSGILQTFPDSASGRDDRFKAYRDKANHVAMEEFIALKNKGGQIIWNAASATELMDGGVVGRVSQGSAKLLYKYNKKDKDGTYKDLVMTIPYAMDINPFTPEGATDVPFEFLKPEFLHNEDEVHAVMERAIEVADRIKRPGTPSLRYETEEEYRARLS